MQVFNVVVTLLTLIAAIVALYYAREAIKQARDGQREAHAWRREDAEERHADQKIEAAARAATLGELQRLHDRMVETHGQQMAEQVSRREADLRSQRLVGLGRVADALVGLADVAWSEAMAPPAPAQFALPPTQLHLMHARLQAAVAVYAALGGELIENVDPLLRDLENYMGGDPPNKFVGLAKGALRA